MDHFKITHPSKSHEDDKKEQHIIALKMLEDGVPYKIIKRYTGIDFSYL